VCWPQRARLRPTWAEYTLLHLTTTQGPVTVIVSSKRAAQPDARPACTIVSSFSEIQRINQGTRPAANTKEPSQRKGDNDTLWQYSDLSRRAPKVDRMPCHQPALHANLSSQPHRRWPRRAASPVRGNRPAGPKSMLKARQTQKKGKQRVRQRTICLGEHWTGH
jgi:hypothetical protein